MSAYYSVLPFTDANLHASISNPHCSAAEFQEKAKAKYLADYLAAVGARTIIIENEYVDADYLDDYSSFYAKCFIPYPKLCKRLHFFSSDISEADFSSRIGNRDSKNDQELNNAYLGFVVARPLPEAVIGRTILKTYPPDGGRRNYTCIKRYSANLFGIELVVESLAFQEQDTALAACATVSLWSAFHKTAEIFNCTAPTPVAITRAASELVSATRPIPSFGLEVHQICRAIRHVGLEPEVISMTKQLPLVSLLFGYVNMGVPVVLGCMVDGHGFHAMTIVGYSILPSRVRDSEVLQGPNMRLEGLRINEFYAHDDQTGPFSRLEIVYPSANPVQTTTFVPQAPISFIGSYKDPQQNRLGLFPFVAIVPIYNKIRLRFMDVSEWITRLNQVVSLVLNRTGTPEDRMEWQLRLVPSNSYKTRLRAGALPEASKVAVLSKPHPRFIWEATLLLDDKQVVQLLFDATAMQKSFPIYEVVWTKHSLHSDFAALLKEPALKVTLEKTLTNRFLEMLTCKL